MKFIKKIPSADQELTEKLLAEGWKKLKEPSNVGMAISRFIIISLMPFILLSVVLPFILNALGWLNACTITL